MINVIVIALALSLGIYGVVAKRGANLVKLDKKMAIMSAIWGLLELAAAMAGYGIGHWILTRELETDHSHFWVHVLAGVLLAVVGIRMLLQAFQKKTLLEHRMESVDMRGDALLALRICVQALIAGISCGLLSISFVTVVIAVFAFSIIFAVMGYIFGRAYGALFTDQAIGAGGVMLCILGVALQFW